MHSWLRMSTNKPVEQEKGKPSPGLSPSNYCMEERWAVGGNMIQCCCVIPTVSGRSAVSEDEKWPTVIVISIAAVFLNQGAMNTLGQIILRYGSRGCSVHCRMFSGLLGP